MIDSIYLSYCLCQYPIKNKNRQDWFVDFRLAYNKIINSTPDRLDTF